MELHIIMMDIWDIISTRGFITIQYTTITIGISELLDGHLDTDIAQIIGIGDQDHIWGEYMEGLIGLEEYIEIMEGCFIGRTKEDCQILHIMVKTEDLIHYHHQEATWMFKGKVGQVERLEMVAVREIQT